jgi:hypothetical protein
VPLPANDITDYRDWLLARTQRAQRGVTVSAVVAAIGLSAAFAHELPGHAAAQKAATIPSRADHGVGAASPTGKHKAAHPHHHHHRPLQAPAQPPAQPATTAPVSPPPVTSGGS